MSPTESNIRLATPLAEKRLMSAELAALVMKIADAGRRAFEEVDRQ